MKSLVGHSKILINWIDINLMHAKPEKKLSFCDREDNFWQKAYIWNQRCENFL